MKYRLSNKRRLLSAETLPVVNVVSIKFRRRQSHFPPSERLPAAALITFTLLSCRRHFAAPVKSSTHAESGNRHQWFWAPDGQTLRSQWRGGAFRADCEEEEEDLSQSNRFNIHLHQVAPEQRPAVTSCCRGPDADGGSTGRTQASISVKRSKNK